MKDLDITELCFARKEKPSEKFVDWLTHGWGVAIICILVSGGVLGGIIYAGNHSSEVPLPADTVETKDTEIIENETDTGTETDAEIDTKPDAETVLAAGTEIISEGIMYTSNGDGTCSIKKAEGFYRGALQIPLSSPSGEKVVKVEDYGFSNCPDLMVIMIENAEDIEFGAFVFSDNQDLETVHWVGEIAIPENVTTSTMAGMFSGCEKMFFALLPENMPIIPDSMFENCRNLTDIRIPERVEEIGNRSFAGCEKLQVVIYGKSPRAVGDYAFAGCTTLTNPLLTERTERIGRYAYKGCTSMGTMKLASTLKEIGEGALEGCNVLQRIEYFGTVEQWHLITKGTNWKKDTSTFTVKCKNDSIVYEQEN